MSRVSTDSYSFSGLNDLSSVHSSNSYTGADELHYDATDMLYSWELSARFNHQVHRGAKLDDLHLLTAVPSSAPNTKGTFPSSSSTAGNGNDNYLLENPFDQSTIHFEDFPLKIQAPSSSSFSSKKGKSPDSTITDELLEQFQKGFTFTSGMDFPSSQQLDDAQSQTQFYQMLAGYTNDGSKKTDCPERPFHLMKTHMNLKLAPVEVEEDGAKQAKQVDPVETIVNMVSCYLNTFSEYDFSYFPKLFMWKGKYLQGSSSCLINIHLYKEKFTENAFIIEANRISGEAKPFHEFFKTFKQQLLSNLRNGNSSPLNSGDYNSGESNCSSFDEEDGPPFFCSTVLTASGSSPTTSPLKKLNCSDFQKSIDPILNMTKCLFYEVKLEAAKMLCDISTCDDMYLRDSKCIDNIFKAIENLILHNDGFLAVKEQAIVAFASFVETNQKEVLYRMMKSNVLHILLQLINNPVNETVSYETAQMRRESARVMSILASFDAKALLQSLEAQQITGHALKRWFENVDFLKDQRTRIYASRIRELLSSAQTK